MKTILIIPDVHNQIDRVERILKSESYDKVIYLGDFFDSFGEEFTELTIKTCEFLLQIVFPDPRSVIILSNHDVSYVGRNPITLCSGYTKAKNQTIKSFIKEEHRKFFKWFHIENNILFSHGCLNKSYIPEVLIKKNSLESMNLLNEWLSYESKQAYKTILDPFGSNHWFLNAGFTRGGNSTFGGLLWGDTREFIQLNGLSNIFGHTPNKTPVLINKSGKYEINDFSKDIILDGTNSIALDTHLNHYGLLNGNKLTIKKYSDL